jgi:hypothetical protein
VCSKASRGSPKSEEREQPRPVRGIELYFSIIHRKVLTPNDFATLALFQNKQPRPLGVVAYF